MNPEAAMTPDTLLAAVGEKPISFPRAIHPAVSSYYDLLSAFAVGVQENAGGLTTKLAYSTLNSGYSITSYDKKGTTGLVLVWAFFDLTGEPIAEKAKVRVRFGAEKEYTTYTDPDSFAKALLAFWERPETLFWLLVLQGHIDAPSSPYTVALPLI